MVVRLSIKMATGDRPFLTDEQSFKDLQAYYAKNGGGINIRKMFDSDPKRFEKFRYVVHFVLLEMTEIQP